MLVCIFGWSFVEFNSCFSLQWNRFTLSRMSPILINFPNTFSHVFGVVTQNITTDLKSYADGYIPVYDVTLSGFHVNNFIEGCDGISLSFGY